MVHGWLDQTPSQFGFAPKAHRRITHMHRLKPKSLEVVAFLLERLSPLRARGPLGPVLVQLPPTLKLDEARLERFATALPRDTCWATEFRHPS